MKDKVIISGFADEISPDFDEQLKTVTDLGMRYICLRAADGKGIADYTVEEVQEKLLPRLRKMGVKVSSIGSPVGKVGIEDEEGYQKQLVQLEELCRMCGMLDCQYIRMFSFFMPEGKDPAAYKAEVMNRLEKFMEIAERYHVTLLHENEKDIYGDIGSRCVDIMERFASRGMRSAFDFANFVQCGEDTERCWDMLRSYVSYIHVKDAIASNRENVLCGTGEGKIKEILNRAINEDGYEGFLTLEPHLVVFSTLSSLETADTKDIIKKDKFRTGAEAYGAQYHALCRILEEIA